MFGHGENRRTGSGNKQQSRFDSARAEAVEQHAERHLGGAEGQEVGAGQQAQRVVAKAEIAARTGPMTALAVR